MRVINCLVMIWRGWLSFLALLCPPPPPSTQAEGSFSEIEEGVQAAPTTLKGKDASSQQSVEGPEVLDSYPKDASGHLERDQQFMNERTKQLVVELRIACQLNTSPGAKPKSSDRKNDSFRNLHPVTTCSGCMFCRPFVLLYFPLPIWCTNGGLFKHAIILAHPSALVATESISFCATACSGLCTACRSPRALSASQWISFLPCPN